MTVFSHPTREESTAYAVFERGEPSRCLSQKARGPGTQGAGTNTMTLPTMFREALASAGLQAIDPIYE
jgi:hypothetical protein